jgi:hypothetical protein
VAEPYFRHGEPLRLARYGNSPHERAERTLNTKGGGRRLAIGPWRLIARTKAGTRWGVPTVSYVCLELCGDCELLENGRGDRPELVKSEAKVVNHEIDPLSRR